jgi:hypothetical protein
MACATLGAPAIPSSAGASPVFAAARPAAARLLPASVRPASLAPAAAPKSLTAGPGGIGIRMVDVPADQVKNPRARAYIIDHLKPGTTIKRRVEVSNTSSSRQSISLYPSGASIVKDTFTGFPGTTPDELSSWIKVSPKSVKLGAHSTHLALVTIAVPKNAVKGERYAAVWAQVSRAATGNSNVGMVSRVGIRIYLDVGPGGDPPSDFQVTGISMEPPSGPWPVLTATVDNTGQRALDMTGSLSMTRNNIKAGPFKLEEGVTIPPGQSAPVRVIINEDLPDGTWNASLALASGTIKHTVKASVTLGKVPVAHPVPTSSSHRLGMILIAGGILLLVVLALLVRRLMRRRRRTGRHAVTV